MIATPALTSPLRPPNRAPNVVPGLTSRSQDRPSALHARGDHISRTAGHRNAFRASRGRTSPTSGRRPACSARSGSFGRLPEGCIVNCALRGSTPPRRGRAGVLFASRVHTRRTQGRALARAATWAGSSPALAAARVSRAQLARIRPSRARRCAACAPLDSSRPLQGRRAA